MAPTAPRLLTCAAAAAVILAALSACGTVSSLRGTDEGASTEKEAASVKPEDPLARPTQVGWTSARASHCGFIFSPDQLRANYIAWEMSMGRSEAEMRKIEKAYDYTRESVTETIKDDARYCTKERTDQIRLDLNRYLSGDYTPNARMAR